MLTWKFLVKRTVVNLTTNRKSRNIQPHTTIYFIKEKKIFKIIKNRWMKLIRCKIIYFKTPCNFSNYHGRIGWGKNYNNVLVLIFVVTQVNKGCALKLKLSVPIHWYKRFISEECPLGCSTSLNYSNTAGHLMKMFDNNSFKNKYYNT